MNPSPRVFVLAYPKFFAEVVSRSLSLAGWIAGGAVESFSELNRSAEVRDRDVVVVVDSNDRPFDAIMNKLREQCPGALLLGLSNTWIPADDRSDVLPLQCGVRDLLSAVARLTGRNGDANPFELTDRQRETLQLMAKGLTANEVANILGLSTKTVNNNLGLAYQRLGASNLTQAVVRAARASLIHIDIAN
jgi:DNA-binding CsgD family transcriptional regulator